MATLSDPTGLSGEGGDGGGGGYSAVPSKSSDYTASENEFVLADASSNPITITLPAASEAVLVGVKKTDSSANAVTIATPNSETIDDDSSKDITAQYTSREVTSDGSNYFII